MYTNAHSCRNIEYIICKSTLCYILQVATTTYHMCIVTVRIVTESKSFRHHDKSNQPNLCSISTTTDV